MTQCNCAHCGEEIPERKARRKAKYCDRVCMAAAYRNSVDRTCETCGETFKAKPAAVAMGSAKYCSYACMGLAKRNGVTLTCAHCGAEYELRESHTSRNAGQRHYCSNECKYTDWRENPERTSNWRGGATEERKNPRLAWRYREWRDAVKERDGHVCQECGETEILHAHHVRSWAEWPTLRFDVSNGQTLCRSCHHAAHRTRTEVAA